MTNIHYLDPGGNNGTPVLMLHGLGVDGSSWGLQFPALINAGFRPIAIDVPGFGSSPYGKAAWSIQRVTSDIAAFLQEKKYHPFMLLVYLWVERSLNNLHSISLKRSLNWFWQTHFLF